MAFAILYGYYIENIGTSKTGVFCERTGIDAQDTAFLKEAAKYYFNEKVKQDGKIMSEQDIYRRILLDWNEGTLARTLNGKLKITKGKETIIRAVESVKLITRMGTQYAVEPVILGENKEDGLWVKAKGKKYVFKDNVADCVSCLTQSFSADCTLELRLSKHTTKDCMNAYSVYGKVTDYCDRVSRGCFETVAKGPQIQKNVSQADLARVRQVIAQQRREKANAELMKGMQ